MGSFIEYCLRIVTLSGEHVIISRTKATESSSLSGLISKRLSEIIRQRAGMDALRSDLPTVYKTNEPSRLNSNLSRPLDRGKSNVLGRYTFVSPESSSWEWTQTLPASSVGEHPAALTVGYKHNAATRETSEVKKINLPISFTQGVKFSLLVPLDAVSLIV